MTKPFKSKLRKAIDLSGVLGDMWDVETAYTAILAAHLDEQEKLMERLKTVIMRLKYRPHDSGYEFILAIQAEDTFDAELANIAAQRDGGKTS